MPNELTGPLPPGAAIGMLGGGQLGRMAALAAAALGYRCHVYCPEDDAPAAQVTSRVTTAAYDDEAALAGFAQAVDVVTLEFENIPFRTAEFLSERAVLRPDPKILRICQNRLREKDFCNAAEVPTTGYRPIDGPAALAAALAELGRPAVLKSTEMGYDGKGQVAIGADTDPAAAWAEMTASAPRAKDGGPIMGILEAFVDFRMEISVVAARGADGAREVYVPVENQHRHHILDQTIAPARIPQSVADKAEGIARHLAEEIGLVGLLAVEMFVTTDDRVLVNELAPRPHNSGHWTIDACVTSQFEQFIRAVAGLPLGSAERLSDAVMQNLLGAEASRAQDALRDPWAKLHLYGKTEARPGRKMGHVTRLTPKV